MIGISQLNFLWIKLMRLFYCISLLAVMSGAFASSLDALVPPPRIPYVENIPLATLSLPPVNQVNLGNFTLNLEQTTLDQVLYEAGVGTIQLRGDAGDSEHWICFAVSSQNQSQRIWVSAGELGGPAHSAYLLYAEAYKQPLEESHLCPELPKKMRPISIDSTIWLGSSGDKLLKKFGSPSKKYGQWWIYSYSGRASSAIKNSFEKKRDTTEYDIQGVLSVRIVDGRIVTLYASKTSTN
jgi:hypothetical protein